MTCWSWLAALSFLLQVPPPTLGTEAAQQLEADRRSIIVREAAELSTLAETWPGRGRSRKPARIRSNASPAGRARRSDAVHAAARSGRARRRSTKCARHRVFERSRTARPRLFLSWPGEPPKPSRRNTRWPACVCVR